MAIEGQNRENRSHQNSPRERSFDDLARGLADGTVTRRQALTWVGYSIAGAALAAIPGLAWAQKVEFSMDLGGSKSEQSIEQQVNPGQNPPGQNPPGQNPPAQQSSGGGTTCQNASDCPPPSDQCQQATCTNGVCGVENKPDGTGCNDGDPCTTNDVCTNGTCAGILIEGCATCQGDQDCSSLPSGPCGRAACVAGSCATVLEPTTTVCRSAAGPCDVEETCNGTSVECPTDQFRPAGFVCNAATGPCENDAVCSGTSATCPDKTFKSSTTVCRPAAGLCDVEETCTGSSAECPPDQFRPAGFVCRPAAGPCDVEETCTGSSAECPPDQFRPNTFVCRASTGPCDPAETCTGTSAACPPNQFLPNGTTGCGNPATRQCCNGVCCGASTPVCCGGTCCRASACVGGTCTA